MQIETMKELAEEIVSMAKNARTDHDVAETQRLYRQFSSRVSDWAQEKLADAKVDHRDTLHADDQRKVDKLKALLGDVKMEVAEMIAVRAQVEANRQKTLGATSSTLQDERCIFPSMREFLEQRAQLIGSEPGGGFLVDGGTSSQFFDRLRPRSVLLSAGPRIIETDSDRVKLPKLKSSVTVVNPGEGGAITPSDIAVERLEVPVRKYATHTIMSAEVVSDSDPSIRRIVQMDHELQLAAALDRDMLEGAGVSKILGLRNQPGVTNTILGSPNGATPTLNDVADALYRLQADNANPSVIFMHPRTWNTLKKIQDAQDR
jgi:HK97 family phage major capsid protein